MNERFRRHSAWACVAVLFTVGSACGARGPLESTSLEAPQQHLDGSLEAMTPAEAGPAGGPSVDGSGPEGGPFGFDGGALFSCGACIAQSCDVALLACLTSAGCRATLQCAATTCISAGVPEPACIAACGMQDPQSLEQLVAAFSCVLSRCGSLCGSLLGRIGGVGGAVDSGGN
jgi:hypothetical protein